MNFKNNFIFILIDFIISFVFDAGLMFRNLDFLYFLFYFELMLLASYLTKF